VIFPDVNVLLYAYDTQSPFHESARDWLKAAFDNEQVFLSWHTITGFLRIVTHSRALKHPTTISKAVSIVETWVDLDNVHIVSFEKRNWPLFAKMLVEGQANGDLVMDAHVAAMAVSCGASIATSDRDFTRFPSVRLIDPLKS
jgi:toxin-antitoxin system PIN domain toxin